MTRWQPCWRRWRTVHRARPRGSLSSFVLELRGHFTNCNFLVVQNLLLNRQTRRCLICGTIRTESKTYLSILTDCCTDLFNNKANWDKPKGGGGGGGTSALYSGWWCHMHSIWGTKVINQIQWLYNMIWVHFMPQCAVFPLRCERNV